MLASVQPRIRSEASSARVSRPRRSARAQTEEAQEWMSTGEREPGEAGRAPAGSTSREGAGGAPQGPAGMEEPVEEEVESPCEGTGRRIGISACLDHPSQAPEDEGRVVPVHPLDPGLLSVRPRPVR